MKLATSRSPKLIVLELSLPDSAGLSLLRQIRANNHAAILVLSAETDETSIVTALDAGANDYVTKPFGSAELLARLRALQRLSFAPEEEPLIINGDLRVSLRLHLITWRSRPVSLSPREEAVFYKLARHAGKMVPRELLLDCVGGSDAQAKLRNLHVHIGTIRQKLSSSAGEIELRTVERTGYQLVVPPGEESHEAVGRRDLVG